MSIESGELHAPAPKESQSVLPAKTTRFHYPKFRNISVKAFPWPRSPTSYWSNPKNPRVSNAIESVRMLEAGVAEAGTLAAGTPADVARDVAKAEAVGIKIAVVVGTSVPVTQHKIRRQTPQPPLQRATSLNDAADVGSLNPSLRQMVPPNWSTWVLF